MKIVANDVIQRIVKEYTDGCTPAELSRKYGVAKSSVYRWINSRTEREVETVTRLSQREFQLMQVELKRLRTYSLIFYNCRCSRPSPLQGKYAEIDRLKGQFHIHALCRVLDVRKFSFYHYQNRSPEKTQIELDDEFFAPKIKRLFEQSKEL